MKPRLQADCTGHTSELQWAQVAPHQLQPHSYVCMPSMHVPMQYTNTFTREAVPGKEGAAHCSLQTDLCGHLWPLSQPFPFPFPPQTFPQHMLPHYSVDTHDCASHPATTLSSHGTFLPYPGACISPSHHHTEVVASVNDVSGDVDMPAYDVYPPSPPSSCPPEIADTLFDFDRLDADNDHLGLNFADDDSDLCDIHAVLNMGHIGAQATDDLCKLFTHDPDDGACMVTAHLHQPQVEVPDAFTSANWQRCLPTDASSPADGMLSLACDTTSGATLKRTCGEMPGSAAACNSDEQVDSGKQRCITPVMDGHTLLVGMSATGFSGNCGHVAAMIKPEHADGATIDL
jgi:hypothetical protein